MLVYYSPKTMGGGYRPSARHNKPIKFKKYLTAPQIIREKPSITKMGRASTTGEFKCQSFFVVLLMQYDYVTPNLNKPETKRIYFYHENTKKKI